MPENEAGLVRHGPKLPIDPDVPNAPPPRPPGAPRFALVRSRWDVLLVISAGGALGSIARWGVGELIPWSGDEFPWATFIENISGAFALGVLMVFLLDVWPPHRYLRPFLGVGLLGGYTTFSTYMFESRELLVAGQTSLAFSYLAGSLVAGLAAVWIGIAVARAGVGLGQRRKRRPVSAEPPTNNPSDRRSTP